MQAHTYAIMNDVEDTHWWFVGRRAILESFMRAISKRLDESRSRFKDQSSKKKLNDRSSVGSETVDGPISQHSSLGTSGDLDPHHSSPVTQYSSLSTSGDLGPQSSRLRILDVGCGTGANLEMLSGFGDAEGVDVSKEALTFCKSKGLKVHEGLAESLPFGDEEFDVVTGLDVIEHLDDDIEGLREMNRVTKSGGYALVFVPAFMWLWGVQDDISNHRIRYTRKQIVERMEKAGFTVERATYANITFFPPILLGRLIMRLTGLKPESENNVNVSALNGFFGRIFSSERHFLKYVNLPIGVSIVVVAKKL